MAKATKEKKASKTKESASVKQPTPPKKKPKVEKLHVKKTFEDDIIKFLKDDKKLNIDIGFMTETGSTVSRWLDTNSYTWNFLSSGRLDGGLPYGRVIEVFGDNFTGKSLLACQLAVQGQKDDAIVIYFDPERSIDEVTIERLGGDPSVIIAPKSVKTIEKFNDTFVKIVERIASEKDNARPVVVILDSLAMLSTDHEMKAPDKVDYTKQKKIRQFFRMYMDDCARYNILLFVVNQVYDNIGVMFGPKTKASGGQGLTYACSQRYGLLSPVIEKSETDSDVFATKVKAKAYKNRNSIPFRSVFIRSTYKTGFDRYGGLWELLTDGDAGKATGFNIISKVKRDDKTKEWVESKTGSKYMIRGVFLDEEGKDIAFSQKEFIPLLQQNEKKAIKKIQDLIDTRNDEAPGIDSLTDEEKIIVGVDDGGNVLSDKELMQKEIEELKSKGD